MRWTPVLLALLLALAGALWTSPRLRHELRGWLEERGWVGSAQESPAYLRRLAAQRRENPTLEPDCLLLVGDSIIEGFDGSGHEPPGAVNRGMSGDRVRHLHDRLETSVRGAPCRVVALCIGTNDLMHESRDSEELARAIVGLAREIANASRVVLVHTLPPPEPPLERLAEPIRRTNAALARSLGADRRLRLVDLHGAIADPEGGRHTVDGIHLRPAAYARWARALEAPVRAARRDASGDAAR